MGVPYVTLTEFNLVNPYHLHNFNEHSFDFFDPDRLRGSAAEEHEISFKKAFHRFHYTREFKCRTRYAPGAGDIQDRRSIGSLADQLNDNLARA